MDIMGRGGGYPGVSHPTPPPGLLDCRWCRKGISGGLRNHIKICRWKFFLKSKKKLKKLALLISEIMKD